MKKVIFVLDFDTFNDRLLESAEYAVKCNVNIWLRIKRKNTRFIYETALNLRKMFPEAFFILSERADIAHLVSFDGVHLNKNSHSPSETKRFFPRLKVGYSAHSVYEINTIDADYYTLSPIYYTQKDYTVRPLGYTDVSELNKKIYALGGINSSNIHTVKKMGFYGAAGVSFIKELDKIKEFFD